MGAKPPSTTGSAILLEEPPSPLLNGPSRSAAPQDRALPLADSVRATSSALPPGVFFVLCAAGYAFCIVLLLAARSLAGEPAETLQVLACAGIAANAAIGLMRARSLVR